MECITLRTDGILTKEDRRFWITMRLMESEKFQCLRTSFDMKIFFIEILDIIAPLRNLLQSRKKRIHLKLLKFPLFLGKYDIKDGSKRTRPAVIP